MTLTLDTRPRDVQFSPIDLDTYVVRSRTWDRLKFEIEYGLQHGTTANSYLIKGDKIALLDPPGESFTEIYLTKLEQEIDLNHLDYVIFGHINSNRLATLKRLLEKAHQVTLVCSKPGANTLKMAFPEQDLDILVVRSEDTLDLGQGHQLKFITVPTPRWPDQICTYDEATKILYSDKLFSVHLCSDSLWDENWKQLDDDRRYYFDCLHAAQSRQVEGALDKLKPYPAKCYAPAHGPLVRYSLSRFIYDYRYWCQQQKTQPQQVVLLYASAYGNTTILAQAITQGLLESEVAVECINCELAEPSEILKAIKACDGFLIGSPTLAGHPPTQIQTALGIVLSAAAKTKLAGVFGSYGWSGEAIDLVESKLKDANYRLGCPTIRVRFSPTEESLQVAKEAGVQFAQALKKNKKLRLARQGVPEAQIDRTEQAVSRIIGSLCVVTTHQEGHHSGILTSWVSQASFNPPGLILAVSASQNVEALIQPNSQFILNILKEGRNLRRHFSYCAISGDNPFADLNTSTAENGCFILTEALSYLECLVQNQIQCGDRWLIYATVEQGKVLDAEGVTAMGHRKSASHY